MFVTHCHAFLSQVDKIIVMKNGEISEIGTYNEILERKSEFAEFLSQRGGLYLICIKFGIHSEILKFTLNL